MFDQAAYGLARYRTRFARQQSMNRDGKEGAQQTKDGRKKNETKMKHRSKHPVCCMLSAPHIRLYTM